MADYKDWLFGTATDPLAQDSLLQQAVKKYPFIANNNPSITSHPAFGQGYAETYPSGEEGDAQYKRPAELPIDSNGIDVYRNNEFGPDDVAGEFLHVDPVANDNRRILANMLTDRQKQYLTHVPDYTFGNGLSNERRMNNAVDSAIRGYVVNQWPKSETESFFTMPQKTQLQKLLRYMTTGNQ